MPPAIKLGANLQKLTTLPVLLASGLILWAFAAVATISQQQVNVESAQRIISGCERTRQLVSVADALKVLCDKTGDAEWLHDLTDNKLQQAAAIELIKKAAVNLPGATANFAQQLDSQTQQPDNLLKTLSQVEDAAKEGVNAASGQADSWQTIAAKNVVWLSGAALALSLLASLSITGRTIGRIRALKKEAQKIDAAAATAVKASAGDEVADLNRLLGVMQEQLHEAFKCEQVASTCLSEVRDGKMDGGQDLKKLREASQACTKLLMDMMPAGLFVLSEDGNIRFSNAAASQFVGQSTDEIIGKPFVQLLSGAKFESPAAFIDLMRRRSWSYVAAISSEMPEETRVQMWLKEFSRQGGQELFLLVMLDYTDDQKFKELQQRLVAMVAHDIATPLSTVHGVLEMTTAGMYGQLNPALQAELSQSASECSQILKHFKNIVRFEKLVSTFSSLAGAQMTLSELTNQAMQTSQGILAEKDLRITTFIKPEAAALGDADEIALLGAKLLQLVVENCKDATAIEISGTREQVYVSWNLLIRDGGDMVLKLQPYLESTDAFDAGVSENLDVILWRLLLQQSGGIVSCSATQKGSTITLRLPAAQADPQPARQLAAT